MILFFRQECLNLCDHQIVGCWILLFKVGGCALIFLADFVEVFASKVNDFAVGADSCKNSKDYCNLTLSQLPFENRFQSCIQSSIESCIDGFDASHLVTCCNLVDAYNTARNPFGKNHTSTRCVRHDRDQYRTYKQNDDEGAHKRLPDL